MKSRRNDVNLSAETVKPKAAKEIDGELTSFAVSVMVIDISGLSPCEKYV